MRQGLLTMSWLIRRMRALGPAPRGVRRAALCAIALSIGTPIAGVLVQDARLARGQRAERVIGAGETHTFAMHVDANRFIQLSLDAGGTLVRLVVKDGAGTVLVDRERRGGDRDPILWQTLVRAS